jgi:HEAT repeat protein
LLALGPASPAPADEAKDARVRTLLKDLESADQKVRRKAMEALCLELKARHLPDIVRVTKDKRAHTRAAMLQCLARLGDNPKAREVLAPVLVARLRDEDAQVRRNAAGMAGCYARPGNGLIPALIKAMDDKDVPELRGQASVAELAATSLGMTKGAGKNALSALVKKVKTGDEPVRFMAVRGLGYMGRFNKRMVPALLPTLLAVLKDKKYAVKEKWRGLSIRGEAAGAIALIGAAAKGAVPALIAVLKEKDHPDAKTAKFVRECVLCALRDIGPNAAAAVPTLLAIVKNAQGEAEERASALDALGGIGPAAKAALAALQKAAKDEGEHYRVRQAAERALLKIQKKPG